MDKTKLDFVPCRRCMGKKHEIIKDFFIVPKGFYETVENGHKVLVECECHKKFMNDIHNLDIFNIANIPFSYKDYKIDKEYRGSSTSNVSNLKYFINNFDKPEFNSAVLYIYGDSGTQKTYTSKWFGAQLISKNKKVAYITMIDLISLLIKSNEDFSSKQKDDDSYYSYVENADFVIIDNAFDKERTNLWKSGYQLSFLDSFLRKRVDNKKGMLIISRYSPTEICSQGFSASIQSLIAREVNLKKTLFEFTDKYDAELLNPKGLFDYE